MTTTDPYALLREPLTGRPPLDPADAPPTITEAPPGMVWTLLPDGTRALAYLPPGYEKTPTTDQQPTSAAPAAAVGPDRWPLRMVAGGASTAAVLGVVGHYGPGLSQAGQAAEHAGLGLGLAGVGAGLLVALIKGALSSGKPSTSVHVNITNTPTANATATSRSKSRSR